MVLCESHGDSGKLRRERHEYSEHAQACTDALFRIGSQARLRREAQLAVATQSRKQSRTSAKARVCTHDAYICIQIDLERIRPCFHVRPALATDGLVASATSGRDSGLDSDP